MVPVVVDEDQRLLASAAAPLSVSRPQPLWSEQAPEDWWAAVEQAVARLREALGSRFSGVRAIGLSGQMHGLVALDENCEVIRPAILWNDSRTTVQCEEIEATVGRERLLELTGNRALAGFTAPKLLWVRKHEPKVFEQVAKVLLPKDYIRYRMTGTYGSDMSDSAGTSAMAGASQK